jgi:nitroreductase
MVGTARCCGTLWPMELRTAIRQRRMVRSFDPDRAITPETVSELLSLAMRAPSAGYTQGWHFLVLDDITSRERFWASTTTGEPDPWLLGMRSAPVLIMVLSDKNAYLDRYAESDKGWADRSESRWPVPYWDIDAGMAALLLLLGSVDAGLASCFFGVPGECWPRVRQAFAIPTRLSIVGMVSIGYAAPDRRSPSLARGRRPLVEVVSHRMYTGRA